MSQFNRYPDDDAVLIVLWNFETSNNIPLSKDLAAILLGGKYDAPLLRPIVHPAEGTLKSYVGEYHLGPIKLEIAMRNGKLYTLATGQPAPYGLIAVSDTQFYCNDSVAEMRFVKDSKGDVNQVVVTMGGKEYPAERTTMAKSGE